MLVVFSTFICSLIAQLALRSRCCGGIIIIGILAPLFRLTIGSLAGFNRCHQQSSREEGDYCPHCLPFEVGGGAHQQLLPHKSRAGDQEFTRYARIAVPTASNNPMVIWSGGSSSAWAYTELGKHERGALISLGVHSRFNSLVQGGTHRRQLGDRAVKRAQLRRVARSTLVNGFQQSQTPPRWQKRRVRRTRLRSGGECGSPLRQDRRSTLRLLVQRAAKVLTHRFLIQELWDEPTGRSWQSAARKSRSNLTRRAPCSNLQARTATEAQAGFAPSASR
jgi:hypothetical protein